MSREGWVILAFTLFVGAVVVGFVGYDIYLHPADPEPVGKFGWTSGPRVAEPHSPGPTPMSSIG